MKILHIIPRWIGGGPERHLIELARQDRLANAPVSRRALVLDRPLSAPLFVKARRFGLAIASSPWAEALEAEIDSADIVEITYWNHPVLLDLLARTLPPARVIIRSAVAGHTIPQVLFPELTSYPDVWQLSAPQGYGASHIERGHPWVEFLPALAEMDRLENFFTRNDEGFRAAYLGSLTPSKIHPLFPELVAMMDSNIKVDIIGDGDKVSTENLIRRLDELGVSERVTFHGHVENIAEVLSTADVFFYPLNPESYATSEKALQEAMWIGLPPVMMTGTAAAGWIDSGKTGFVASDPREFADRVNLLARDEKLRLEIGSSARKFARDSFDPVTGAKRNREIYDRLLSMPKRTRAPLQSQDWTGGEKFCNSIGFDRVSFLDRLERASDASPESNFMLLKSEGGLLHYRNHYPSDSDLRDWISVLTQ
jgi:L-malate glycosyltransferase